jgi:hypothetical protein
VKQLKRVIMENIVFEIEEDEENGGFIAEARLMNKL